MTNIEKSIILYIDKTKKELEMNYMRRFKEGLSEYDSMSGVVITRNDYTTCKDNYDMEYGRNQHLKNYEDFISWCAEYWG